MQCNKCLHCFTLDQKDIGIKDDDCYLFITDISYICPKCDTVHNATLLLGDWIPED